MSRPSILVLSLVFTKLSLAQVSNFKHICGENLNSKKISEIYVLDKSIPCEKLKQDLRNSEEILNLSPIAIPKITISLSLEGEDASNKAEHLEIPVYIYSYDKSGRFELSNSVRKNYLAHEIGHSIFNEIIRSEINGLTDSLLGLEKLNQLRYQINQSEMGLNQSQQESLRLELEQKEESFFTTDKYLDPIFKILPLSELFSDLIAVLYAEDYGAFAKTYLGEHPTENQWERASYRDFSFEHNLETWDNSSRHEYYAPTRSYLGSKIEFPMPIESKRKLIDDLGRMMGKFLAKDQDLENLSPKENNILIIKRIKKYFY